MSLARRYRRPPAELPALLAQWKDELRALDAAADLDGAADARCDARSRAFDAEAQARVGGAPRGGGAAAGRARHAGDAAARHGRRPLRGRAGWRRTRRSRSALESAEFLVAGHAGSTPRPLAKVASGGELSRIALAIAVTTSQLESRGERGRHADLRRDRRRRRRRRRRDGRPADEAARPRPRRCWPSRTCRRSRPAPTITSSSRSARSGGATRSDVDAGRRRGARRRGRAHAGRRAAARAPASRMRRRCSTVGASDGAGRRRRAAARMNAARP